VNSVNINKILKINLSMEIIIRKETKKKHEQ